VIRKDFDLQGHRGARGLVPENTLPAFRRAIELGVTTLELDVVISADNEVVVSHDPWFSSKFCTKPDGTPVTADEEQSLKIYSMTYDEIARFDCGSRRHVDYPEQQLQPAVKPLLRDVIVMAEAMTVDTEREPVRYNIETKSRRGWEGDLHPAPSVFAGLLYAVLEEQHVLGRSTIQSFDGRTLRAARRMNPQWNTSLLVSRWSAKFISLNLRRLGFVPHIYSPDHRSLSARLVRSAHRRGMLVIPWTTNTDADISTAIRLGVDGIITDYPDRARGLLERFLAPGEV
jgi:glycerophosphoryl diester phosphodiesterase